jgi:hypothetical protein
VVERARLYEQQMGRPYKSILHAGGALFFISLHTASAQTLEVNDKKLFSDQCVIEMTRVSDFRKMINDKLSKDFVTNYRPATIACLFPDSTKITEQVEIRPRGDTEGKSVIC